MVKKQGGRLEPGAKGVHSQRIYREEEVEAKVRAEMEDAGLKCISEGKLCVVLQASGMGQRVGYTGPKICHKLDSELDCSAIEFFLKKLKAVGERAVGKFGKSYKGNRQPIMVLLMANEYQIEEIEEFLVSNRYFGYTGIIVLSQAVIPIINTRGRIMLNGNQQICFGSDGSGGFMANLKKTQIFSSWVNAGVQHLNIIDITNLEAKIADPFSIGLTLLRGYECLTHAVEDFKPKSTLPAIMQNAQNSLIFLYPYQVQNLVDSGQTQAEQLSVRSAHLNIFTSVEFLANYVEEKPAELFTYSIKEKRLFDDEERIGRVEGKDEWLPNYFTFEINAFNLFKFTNRSCVLLGDLEGVALVRNGPYGKEDTEEQAVGKLRESSKKWFREAFGADAGKVRLTRRWV